MLQLGEVLINVQAIKSARRTATGLDLVIPVPSPTNRGEVDEVLHLTGQEARGMWNYLTTNPAYYDQFLKDEDKIPSHDARRVAQLGDQADILVGRDQHGKSVLKSVSVGNFPGARKVYWHAVNEGTPVRVAGPQGDEPPAPVGAKAGTAPYRTSPLL